VICGLGVVVGHRRIEARQSPVRGMIDWASAALLGAGLGLVVLALYPDDPANRATGSLFIPAGIASLVLLGVSGWRQLRRLEPLVPRVLLRSSGFIGSSLANLLIGGALMVALV